MTAGLQYRPSRRIQIMKADGSSSLPFNQKVGHLTIGPNRPMGREKKIYAACDCGHKGMYTIPDLSQMIDGYSGCGRDDCTAMSYHDKLWTSEESLRIQLFTILLLKPELVQSWWGGTMDDFAELDFDTAYENLLMYLNDNGCVGVWLGREKEGMAFIEGNVALTMKPDSILRRFSRGIVTIDEQPFTMRELCEISGLNAEKLILKIYEWGTTDDLLYRLMEEKENGGI